jgi:flavin reductase (DIM6/NTAB) family NADH-FMN oxidoreductase RutF
MSTDAATLKTRFRGAMRRNPAAVTIITASRDGEPYGMTATAMTSVSMDPPSLLVCVNRSASFHSVMNESQRFCVNLLQHAQSGMSAAFSGAVPPSERFAHPSWFRHASGLFYLESAHANIFCLRTAMFPYGSHTIFIGEIEEVLLSDMVPPLIYHDAAYCTSAAMATS